MLRVVTLNIWGNHSPWATRRQLIRQELARLSPDVVALQEVLRPLGPGTSQADELAEGLPYRVCFGRACAIEKPFPAEFGNAALIKQPLREQRLLKLPTPPDRETRSALYVLLSMKVGLLPVVVTHLSWEPELAETRALQLGAIRQLLSSEMAALPSRVPPHVPILPPLLLGDLNAPPESRELAELLVPADGPADGGLRFSDTFAQVGQGRGATFSSTNPYCPLRDPVIDQRIDYILIGLMGAQDRLTVSSSRLCFSEGQEGVFPSDHFGVLTELSLATEPAPKAAPEDS
jgi:endonuclease/exonuclease/phosphatase family metal-dependent hydrolase